jgi:hypothetical protein
MMGEGHEREFMPIREPRERSLDRSAVRDRYLEDELYGSRSARQSPNPHLMTSGVRDTSGMYIDELQSTNNDLQRELAKFKKELELTNQKLGSSMHSIKTFWSPELKKERALRKEESAKYSLINDQLKLLNSENQVWPLAAVFADAGYRGWRPHVLGDIRPVFSLTQEDAFKTLSRCRSLSVQTSVFFS